ncbi:HugZ family protein [Paracoccus marinaquae]|uniref:Pyridoxamine 5-phosphate oxidase n=1 Tax=Paracoccus marinaquae TaxID=2841926 RepID=A0ABS6AI25_9RHOB|nr:pyridoxamine 5-phosphate oxidase [Paracoccus marinaquae]MBU3029320.1 pyridoxamine 5-phosphate oxidase [Paracoccus marinaquae]
MSKSPIRNTDDLARGTARGLLDGMCHATLAVIDPETGHPHLSRILCQTDADGQPMALLAGLATHSRALAADPRAGLLVENTQPKGDPMTWPRLSLQVTASQLPSTPERRERWLERHPRSQLFLGLPDFAFWQLTPLGGLLNAGFGAAFRLTPADLALPANETSPQG